MTKSVSTDGEPGDTVLCRVVRLIEEVLECPRGAIGIETRACDVEAWDSFGHVRIVLAVEAEFAVSLTMSEIEGAISVAALVETVEAALCR